MFDINDISPKILYLTILFGVATTLIWLKRYFSGGVCVSKNRLDGKIVIITGANQGIGYEVALDLAKRGAHVILACRNMNRAQDAYDKIKLEYSQAKLDIELLDCSSLKSVKEFADRFVQKYNRLDILINNAGISSEKFKKSLDGIEMTFQVNYLSHFYLTNLLIDMLKNSAPSRIINVSSGVHFEAKMNWNDLNLEKTFNTYLAYKQSKLANVLFTFELARRYKEFGIVGVILTEIWQNLLQKSFVVFIFKYIIAPFIWLTFKTSKEGAQTTIHCAVDDSIPNYNGLYFSDCKIKTASKEITTENALKLWNISLNLIDKRN